MNAETHNNIHIPFEELSSYVFSPGRPVNMAATAAIVNNHVMMCSQCKEKYYALMALKDETDRAAAFESSDDFLNTRMFAFLYSVEHNKPIQLIANECLGFKKWLSFSIKNLRELSQSESAFFTYPRLVTAVKSQGGDQLQEETTLKSSLCDTGKNRVSIGLDGTLTLYFNMEDHPVGKRVAILPEDSDETPQMFELTRYDSAISFVRFEGVSPGQYTIVVEK